MVHQIEEEVGFVLKVHVEAAPRDTGGVDDAVDGGVGIRNSGKFLPGTAQKSLPFGLRQTEEGIGGHGQLSFQCPAGYQGIPAHDRLSYMIYDSLSCVNRFDGEFQIRSQFPWPAAVAVRVF